MQRPIPRADLFSCLGWSSDPERSTLTAHYACSRFGRFSETFHFPVYPSAFSRLVSPSYRGIADLLCLAAGVSYYKVGAAHRIAFPPLTLQARAMAEALYTEGLAEFFLRADLPWPADLEFTGERLASSPTSPLPAPSGPALVAFGGGKDSYVARAILSEAQETVTLASVTLSDALKPVLRATAPAPIRFFDRRLDPRLMDATKEGFNGHVPITAINMLILCADAVMSDHGQVIFANERSADEPTAINTENGTPANHQYSKSSHFEGLIHNALSSVAENAPVPYSLLRPFSELWIGSAFAKLDEAFDRFTSCNKNFRLAGDASQRWCGACAKCAFTSLIVAPFSSKEKMHKMFGADFLNKEELQPLRRDILGLSDQKPWDCVGTIAESRAALWKLNQQEEHQESLAVRTLMPLVLAESGADALEKEWHQALSPHPTQTVPAHYLDAAARIVS